MGKIREGLAGLEPVVQTPDGSGWVGVDGLFLCALVDQAMDLNQCAGGVRRWCG